MKRFLSRLSFGDKLRTVVFVTAGVAMLIAISVQSVSGLLMARKQMVEDVSALAEIIGATTRTAITFGDADEATRSLLSLSANPSIKIASLYRPDGSVLASYAAGNDNGMSRAGLADTSSWVSAAMASGDTVHRLQGRTLDLVAPVRLNREIIGWLHLRSLRTRFDGASSGWIDSTAMKALPRSFSTMYSCPMPRSSARCIRVGRSRWRRRARSED